MTASVGVPMLGGVGDDWNRMSDARIKAGCCCYLRFVVFAIEFSAVFICQVVCDSLK